MKNSIYIFTLILTLLFATQKVSSQILHFSQYYASPTILGPSFAGSNHATKAAMNYRNQWPGIPGNFVTYSFAFDHFFEKRNSGVGLLVLRDEAGAGDLSLTDVGVMYSYELPITRDLSWRPGITFKYSSRGLDFYKLTFGDQLTNMDQPSPTSIELPPEKNIGYIDGGVSMLFYTDRFWAGVTADHLLRPNQSFFGEEATVPIYIASYGGYKIPMRDKRRRRVKGEFLTFTYLFKMQGSFKQLDLGVIWDKNDLTAGLWYRGLPVLNNPEQGYKNNDAVILMLGYTFSSLHVGYSYDITINSLMKNTAGSHEVSLIYDFNLKTRRPFNKKRTPIPCPGF